jgi:methionyl-tRNA formyltransferase
MRFGFVTCVQLGLACMEEIYAAGGRLDLALSLRDDKATKKSGRIYLDEFCDRHGIPLVKIRHINDPEAEAAIRAGQLDWLFIIGWSQIAGVGVLRAPRRGALGIHPTLLPEGRGRAAIPWAILKNLRRTGVTLFRLETGVDTGPVAAQVEIPIAPDETATSLYQRVSDAHRTLLREALPGLTSGTVRFTPQDESRATYWPARTPEDGRILPTMSVAEVDRLVRAATRPYPGAFIEQGGVTTRIWRGRIAAGDPASPAVMRLVLADGAFDALEWERDR